jgi:hypothetical protein
MTAPITIPASEKLRPLLKLKDAAGIVGVSRNTFMRQLDEGRWLALSISGRPNSNCLRIIRLSLAVSHKDRLTKWKTIISQIDNWLFPSTRAQVFPPERRGCRSGLLDYSR